MRKFALAVLIAVLTGCAGMQPKITQTVSGHPEITLNTDNLELVKGAIVSEMQTLGAVLQSDSNYRLAFSKQMSGMNAVLTQIAIGNQYSTTPDANIFFTISKIGSTIRVVAFCSVSTQMPFGQTQTADMSGNNAWFNELQRVLYAVENDLAAQSAKSSATAPAREPGVRYTDVVTYDNGAKYTGELKDGKPDGYGVFIWKDGGKYAGDWRAAIRYGHGTYVWASGDRYEGGWSADKRNGSGVMTYTNGVVQSGMWRDDAFVGSATNSPSVAESQPKSTQ